MAQTRKLSTKELRADLVARFEAAADPKTKAWFDNYLKGAITYRGLKSPKVIEITSEWRAAHNLGERTAKQELRLLAPLMRSRWAEDKLCVFAYIQRFLIKRSPPAELLEFTERAFQRGHVYDWSTNDWLCMRVVCPLVAEGDEEVARRVEGWHRSSDLWQRRSSIVGFLESGRAGGHHDVIARQIERLVGEDERFIQTGIGWTIAQVSRKHAGVAARWVEAHLDSLSREVIDRHTKYLPKHAAYKAHKRKR